MAVPQSWPPAGWLPAALNHGWSIKTVFRLVKLGSG